MNVTLKKISEVLDLSISTVSRALKNHPDISTATRQRVAELAAVLDYEPNANAVNLRKQNNNVFGLMVPSVANTFYGSFVSALEECCRRKGFSLIIMQSDDDPEVEKNILKLYRQNRVSGCFACLSAHTVDFNGFHKLTDLSIPIVFFDKVPIDGEYNRVTTDDAAAAKLAAQALVDRKKKHILALFGKDEFSISQIRRKEFVEVVEKEKGIKLVQEVAESTDKASEIIEECFSKKDKPDAIFCMSDEIMLGVVKKLQQLGVKYPEETGLICMSDGFFPKLFYPQIAYVETSGYKLGEHAFELMVECIGDQRCNHHTYVPPKLVEGDSL